MYNLYNIVINKGWVCLLAVVLLCRNGILVTLINKHILYTVIMYVMYVFWESPCNVSHIIAIIIIELRIASGVKMIW